MLWALGWGREASPRALTYVQNCGYPSPDPTTPSDLLCSPPGNPFPGQLHPLGAEQEHVDLEEPPLRLKGRLFCI